MSQIQVTSRWTTYATLLKYFVLCHALTSRNCTQQLLPSECCLPLITNELLQRSMLTNVNVSQVPDGEQVWKIMKSQTYPYLKNTVGNSFFFSFSLLRLWSQSNANDARFMSLILQIALCRHKMSRGTSCHIHTLATSAIHRSRGCMIWNGQSLCRNPIFFSSVLATILVPPSWYWAFVSGNNIKTILWQRKLSLCLPHF